jgi:hypothetical protein
MAVAVQRHVEKTHILRAAQERRRREALQGPRDRASRTYYARALARGPLVALAWASVPG